MLFSKIKSLAVMSAAMMLSGASVAYAEAQGHAEPWQMLQQEPATSVMEMLRGMHDNLLLPIIIGIVALVLVLMIIVAVRFNARANPTPSKTSHNTLLEVVWTVVPIMILVVIAIPSFRLLYFQDKAVDADITIKAIGSQWYWTYEYPDYDDLSFDAVMVPDNELKDGQLRLLTTDNALVLPVGVKVRLLTTAADVIHSWAVPSFGVKLDAVPGRINETWFPTDTEGTFYGQCSELCGKDHGFMPIMVKVVSKEEFKTWLKKAKEEFASRTKPAAIQVAANDNKQNRE